MWHYAGSGVTTPIAVKATPISQTNSAIASNHSVATWPAGTGAHVGYDQRRMVQHIHENVKALGDVNVDLAGFRKEVSERTPRFILGIQVQQCVSGTLAGIPLHQQTGERGLAYAAFAALREDDPARRELLRTWRT
jgi:hypothetical protein